MPESQVNTSDAPRYLSDEIDLRELITELWRAKLLIGSVAVLVTAMAIGYFYLQTPVFETQLVARPPTASDLIEYNGTLLAMKAAAGKPGMPDAPLAPIDAYNNFLTQLHSATVLQAFFERYYLPDHPEVRTESAKVQLQAALEGRLSIQEPGGGIVTVTLAGTEPRNLARWLNLYVDVARNSTMNKLSHVLKAAANQQRKELDSEIQDLRDQAETARTLHIQRLQDALVLARAANLSAPLSANALVASYEGPTLFLRGTRVLQAEIELLQNRARDYAYSPRLAELQRARAKLDKTMKAPQFEVVTIDRRASPPLLPQHPPDKKILILGAGLGLMLGVAAALLRRWMKR